ncbi:unnamed protein product [Miscanthus lutarioriparius]|uniref:NB-ARC domain-containing protein n=1 Tax=Miscanthus lutarioriparius TaxID=422564 RepID=A0A811SKW6_9POAL|nr:unnamed protein product [Miscanthus lutarioriparius]
MALEDSLQRALLRAQVIDEEAMGRHITNQALIQQLGMLRDAMHRGYYALDAFRYQPHYREEGNDPAIRGFMSLSKVPSPKDPYFFSRTAQSQVQLEDALDRLRSMMFDLNESVIFMMSYPRLYRQPCSMHILLGNCMFGRQMEAELVIKFLLHTHPHCSQELEVMPIVGPPRVGKSTLVAHVCKDERVRDYFSEILWLCEFDFTNDELVCRQGYVMNHKNRMPNSNRGKRFLVVIELSGNLSEEAWNRLYLGSRGSFSSGSKIIVTSRSDKIVKFGTTPALTLKFLSKEAYWYFFKTLTFGSMDPEKHPSLAQLAMEIARLQYGSFHGAYIMSYLLRDNLNIHFWRKVLSFLRRAIQKHVSEFGVHPFDLLYQNRPVQHGRMATPSEDFMICHQYHRSPQEEVPEIRIQDLLFGSIKRHGKFEVLVWRCQLAPYYSYVNACEIRKRKITVRVFSNHTNLKVVYKVITQIIDGDGSVVHLAKASNSTVKGSLGELMTRSMNFIIDKFSKPPALTMEESLQRTLLRAQAIDEEAMVRHITNQAMIQQLGMLRDAMHRGYYTLDAFRYQPHYGEDDSDQVVSRFMSLSKPHSSQELEVLPIVGPPRVGKSTLVAHVCKDERVRDYFSEILWLCDSNFINDELACREGCVMKHQNQVSNSNKGKRLLVVIELSRNLYEDAWSRFYLASKRSFCCRSKIIVTSRLDRVAKFGTAQALTLKHLSHEAYWYFFKTLTFGSMDPETHPRLAQLSMEIARTQKRLIIGAYITSYLLRNNFDINFWCKVLKFWRGIIRKHVSKFGVHPSELFDQNRYVQIGRMTAPSEDCMLCRQYQHSSQEEVPEIRVQDILYGSIKLHGKFEVLLWRSQIPPYYSYLCEIRERKATGAKRKRSMKDGVTFC